MKSSDIMKACTLVCLMTASAAFATSPSTVPMPEGFERIQIRMAWPSLVALRPEAEIMDMMPEPGADLTPQPGSPRGALVETLTGGFYDRVVYFFEDGILLAVMFVREAGRSTPLEAENVVRAVGRGRGEPAEIRLTGMGQRQGVVSWRDRDLHIEAWLPAGEVGGTPCVVGLRVMDRQYAAHIDAARTGDDTPADPARKREAEVRLEAFKARVKTCLAAAADRAPGALGIDPGGRNEGGR